MRLGTKLIVWIFSPSKNPYVYKGRKDGEKRLKVSVNPCQKFLLTEWKSGTFGDPKN